MADANTETAAVETSDGSTTDAAATATKTGSDLGDAGKQAIDRMKAELAEAKKELSAFRAASGDKRGLDRIEQERKELEELRALKAKSEGREAEYQAAQVAQRAKDEALAAANERILKAEVRAAAAAKLADPADALRFLNMSDFEVGADGEVNSSQVAKAIDDLIASKPYLAAQGRRFPGSADGGPRKESDVSIDDQIAAAQKAGNFAQVIALKRRKAYADKT